MLKKTISYTDFNEHERTEDFWFNLTEAELIEMEMSMNGGLSEMIQKIVRTQDTSEIIKIFKKLILASYGEKSMDGKRFIKSKELSDGFSQTNAFSKLFMELATDDKAAAEFVDGIVPQRVAKNAQAKLNAAQ